MNNEKMLDLAILLLLIISIVSIVLMAARIDEMQDLIDYQKQTIDLLKYAIENVGR